MNFETIFMRNNIKSYVVIACYVLIFMAIGLLVDMVRINANGLDSGLYDLISLKEFPLVSFIMLLAALGIIAYSINRFDAIMLEGDEVLLIKNPRQSSLEWRIWEAFNEVLAKSRCNISPRLYLIKADYMNAFASGWREDNCLIAVTEGLAQQLSKEELQAVLAHELSHIKHGDIRLTMCVGILSNILLLVCNRSLAIYGK